MGAIANVNQEPPARSFGPHNLPAARASAKLNGTRPKLAKAFFKDVYAIWEEQGEAMLRRVAFHEPAKLLAIVAHLMPQKLEITTPTDGMSDERLEQLIELAQSMAALRVTEGQTADGAPGVIEGQAVEVMRGGGGPPALGPPGGENVLVHTPDYSPNPLPEFSGEDSAEGPEATRVADMSYPQDDVDPESLF